MQKYKSNLTSVSGAAVRGASITVLDESGANASIFLDRDGTLPAGNPLKTAQDGTFEFYASNGRYSLRTDSSGLNVLEEDVIMLLDPDQAAESGPIGDAIKGAQEFTAYGGSDPTTVQKQLLGQNDEAPVSRGFWADDPSGANIHRFRDRSFFGDGVKHSGRRIAPLGESWLTKYGANYFEKNSYNIMLSEEDRGRCPLIVGCYTGPDETVSNYNMGFGAVTVNRGVGTMGRAAYLEAFHFGDALQSLGLEIQVGNYSNESRSANPYLGSGNADGLTLGAESGYGYVVGDSNTPIPAPTGPAGTAIFVKAGTGSEAFRRYRQGLLFSTGSLFRGTDGLNGNALAIGLAQGHELAWYASSTMKAVTVRSDITAIAGDGVGIIFKNASVQVVGNAESPLASFTHDKVGAGGVNYVDLKNARVNVYPQLTATGADTNIGIDFRSKGTGPLRFFTRGGAGEELRLQSVVAAAVNFVAINGQSAGSAPRITVLGADANIDLELSGKGAGVVKLGYGSLASANAAAFTADRCIPIKDASGNTFYVPAKNSAW